MQVAVKGLYCVIVLIICLPVIRASISGGTSHILTKAIGGFPIVFLAVSCIYSAIALAKGLIVLATITLP